VKTATDSNPLCLECGLCCNGVIFANGQLQPKDDVLRLQELGLKLIGNPKPKTQNPKFRQPCAAFDGCRCQIYAERPQYCRAFDCALLQQFKAGQVKAAAALRSIRLARRRADKVGKLLRELGDANEGAALSVRFRKMQRRAEVGGLDEEGADRFGELTLAMQDLNFLLSETFYPGG
jgi:Fe-S-cluster containining protein